MKIKNINSLNSLQGKKIFLRLDFNVPMKAGKIKDDYKIKAGLETINFLMLKKSSLIIATHLGKPKGKNDKKLSTAPLARRLAKLSGKPVKFIPDLVGDKAKKAVLKIKPGEIIFLENLRFNQGELDNDNNFAKELASLADIYVNDAFAVSHRAQASVSAIKKYLPAYAGLLLAKEVQAIHRALKPKKPLVTIMGGAKIATKAPLIKSLYPASKYILLGGGLANNFLKFYGLEIGRSLYDKDSLPIIKKLLKNKLKNKKIILPIDVVVQEKSGRIKSKKVADVKKSETIFDIGPETVNLYAGMIKKAQTLIWNGPMGKFEEISFKYGTMAIARLMASRSSGKAYGIAGGGETVEALKMSGMMEHVDWISTAGGAMLAYLSKEKMPGLTKIIS